MAELLAGKRIHERSGIANLTIEEWLARWRERRPGFFHLRLNRWQDALDDCSAALALAGEPEHPLLWGLRGCAKRGPGEWEDALGDLSRAIELGPAMAQDPDMFLREGLPTGGPLFALLDAMWIATDSCPWRAS